VGASEEAVDLPCLRAFRNLGLQEIEWVILGDYSGGTMMETGFFGVWVLPLIPA
jgi:hypothetical protein